MAEADPPHEAAFKAQFEYMVKSMDAGSVAPACLAVGLISDRQRDECFRESSLFKKAELLLGYVKRSITGDGTKFDTFVAILRRTGHSRQADKLTSPSPLATTPSGVTASSSPPATTPSGVTATPPMPVNHLLSPAMQRYVSYLKNVYKMKATPVYDKEHSLLRVKAKSFINIALVHKHSSKHMKDSDWNEIIMDRLHGHVDAIQKSKTKLPICNICKNQKGDLARSVLVEGAPGVGKTTFAYELCKRWARGEILWEWAAVVLIKLRDHRTRTALNMHDLLYHPRPEVKQAVVDEFIDHDGEYILLILDGYDELTDAQKKSTHVIQQIMSRELLVRATVMVTSRPLATRTLHDNFVQSVDQHIEVLGFTEKNIEEYIQSACGDNPELVEDFKSYLSSHPFSSALMFNPLQCAIVTDLYRSHWESGDKGFAPKTLTELYTGLVHIMLVRYLTQHPVYKDRYWRMKDFSDLPKEVNQQFKAVTELAANGIRNQQYVFDEVNPNIIPSETLGLMQKEEVVASGIGLSTSHNFLHLTLQEYLAAVSYSQQCSSPEQLSQLLTRDDLFPLNNFLQCYGMKRKPALYSSATHWPVVLFVAGRTKLSGVPTKIFKTGLHHSNDYDGITKVDVSLLHLLYETQSPQLIQSTLVTSRKYLSSHGSSALDWFVIGYCIANSTSTWRVEKKGNDSSKYFDQLVMGLRLGPEECSGECKIGSLHISGHWTGNMKNLSNLQPHAKSVSEIKLVGHKQKEQYNPEKSGKKLVSEEVCAVSACYPMLEQLTIDNIEISYSASLLRFTSQHSNLHILSLNQCNLSSIATSSLIHFIHSPNNKLHKLTLVDCTIQIPNHTHSVGISYYELKLISPTNAGNFSLQVNGSLYAINYVLSQPDLFNANTLTILKVSIVKGNADSLQIPLYLNLVTLEIVSKSRENTALHYFPCRLRVNNLCTFSFTRCHFSNKCIYSLIRFLVSNSNNRLCKLTLDHCTIQISDDADSVAISHLHMVFISQIATGNFYLTITSSLDVINYILSQPACLFFANALTVLKVVIMSGTANLLEIDTHSYPNLSVLNITSARENYNFLAGLVFHGISQLSNLHILSIERYNLECDTVRPMIHSLQSSHCGLKELTLNDCLPADTAAFLSKLKLKSLDGGNVSIEFTGYYCDISHWLSHLSSDKQLWTKLILHFKKQDSTVITRDMTLVFKEILFDNHLVLKSLKIDFDEFIYLPHPIPQLIGSQHNNLCKLSLNRCILSIDVTRSLIHSLQSPHCRLQKLTMDHCTISTPNETQQNVISTKNNTTLCSLVTSDSLCVLNHILSNVVFTQMTDLNLCITTCNSVVEVLTKIPVSCPVLKTMKIDSSVIPSSISRFIESQQNNLHTLSLSGCNLSSDVTRSLIHSMLSLHCKLQNLTLRRTTISLPEDTQQTTVLMKMNVALHSLNISWSVLNQMMSYINPFTQSLTELILHVDNDTHTCTSGVEKILQDISSKCPLLETLKIDSDVLISLPLSIPRFIGSQQNNLHTLSLRKCNLSSDATRSLIDSLQSPHCKLYKLALCICGIPTTDHTQLTTAIVSCTAITHLLFIDENIDTPSLTALASGLKHNTTIEHLAVDKYFLNLTNSQFKLLIDAVNNNSTVKKLWVDDYYQDMTCLNDYRIIVNISYFGDLYNEW